MRIFKARHTVFAPKKVNVSVICVRAVHTNTNPTKKQKVWPKLAKSKREQIALKKNDYVSPLVKTVWF